MADMPGDGSPDLATAGRRLRVKVLVALTLASGVPILVLAYVVRRLAIPGAGSDQSFDVIVLRAVLIVTVVAVLAGAYIIWDIGGTIARMAQGMASEQVMGGLVRRNNEVGTLMGSFNKMLTTIEHQAAEINSFATRLDAAYKELESTNARLKETSFKDEVTGLYNRPLEAWANEGPASLGIPAQASR